MKSKVKIKRIPRKAIAELKKLNKQFDNMPGVLVGLPKGSKDHEDENGDFTSIIKIGFVHEWGTDKIPQRSFLRSTLAEGKRKYKDFLKKLSKKVVKKELSGKQSMGLLGERLQGDVKEKITDIKTPPLKVRDGNPLVDTGQLRSSITYIIREK